MRRRQRTNFTYNTQTLYIKEGSPQKLYWLTEVCYDERKKW